MRSSSIDFGIAQDNTTDQSITQDARVPGSLGYMSPEHHRGKPLTQQSDIFCWGLIAFELLSLLSPYAQNNTFYTHYIEALTKDAPNVRQLNPAVPRWLATLIKNCLRLNPRRRYRSMEDLKIPLSKRITS